MHIVGRIAVLLLGVLTGGPHTLQEQLQDVGIPQKSFSEAELNQKVDGYSIRNDRTLYFVYIRRNGDELMGEPQVVRYDTGKNALLRSEVKPEDENLCCGSPESIDIVDDFLLLTFHLNPSAAFIVVLNDNLKTVKTLYGFDTERIATNQVVFAGNMVHFASTHAEQLNFINLRNGKLSQLYPSENDALRARFIDEHRKRMPSQDVCKQLEDDPCEPTLFDENWSFLGTDGNGQFAIVVDRDASHAPVKDADPVSVLSESALYLYAHGTKGWVYCEQTISDSEERKFQPTTARNLYTTVKDRCIPNIPVVPDQSN